MVIKYATKEDIAAIAAVEAECFPPAEAATEKEFVDRVKYYGNHFWLMYEAEKLIAFVDGFVTDEPDLTDEMYEKATLHDENGAWQMIFGVNTIPAYRKHGYGLGSPDPFCSTGISGNGTGTCCRRNRGEYGVSQ